MPRRLGCFWLGKPDPALPPPQRHAPVHAVHFAPSTRRLPARRGLLSWGSSRVPSADIHTARPLPVRPKPDLRLGGATLQVTFRPCRSSRLRRFPPRAALQVCCTLQPAMGSATLLSFATRLSTRCWPFRGARPFEAFPSLTAAIASPRLPGFTAMRSPLAVASRPPRRTADVATDLSCGSVLQPTSGSCAVRESVADVPCCHGASARCSPGFWSDTPASAPR